MNPEKVIVAASILASDFSDLRGEARRAEAAGADWLHLDIMDGHFVDNISFGPAVVSAVHKSSSLPVDVHLMIDRPDHYFSRFIDSAKNITIHVEADHDVAKTLRGIREAGCTAGLALRPATAFENVIPYLKEIDLLLVMTVEPGFGGQPFMPDMMKKVETAVQYRDDHHLSYHIEVDGGINAETSPLSIRSGANVLVAGTSVFGAKDMAAAIKSLRGGI
ncbi:MAG: ribulose-phosphate 3-epimerase [Chthoniobacteraceae bacterium]